MSSSTFYGAPYLHLDLGSRLSLDGDDPDGVRRIDCQGRFHFVHQQVIFIPKIALGLVTFSFAFWRGGRKKKARDVGVSGHLWSVSGSLFLVPGQVLQHFPADFMGCWHGYWLGHVMRLQSWRPSVQVHRMHSRTFPKTGCHMSP